MRKQIWIPTYTVKRELPASTKNSQVSLFSHELSRTFGPIYKYEIDNATLLSNGLIFKSLKLVKKSLKHLRLKESVSLKTQVSITVKYLIRRIFKKSIKLEIGFWVTDIWSKGYFHWMADALPSIIKFQNENIEIPILIPEDLCNIPFISDSLSSYGIKYIPIRKGAIIKLKTLIFSDHLAKTGNYHPETMWLMKNIIDDKINASTNFDKIYITRKNASKRNLVNENEIATILKEHNFNILALEDLSWADQIAKFKSCCVLLGQHGAGLVNMIYMPSKSKVIEIRPKNETHNNCYFALASIFQHKYDYIEATIVPNSNDHIGDMQVELLDISTIISK